jgi:FkbM family methyltransferase
MSLLRSVFARLPVGLRSSLRSMRHEVLDTYASCSYSQEGEDLILRRMFDKRATGFFIDVGAHHPKRFSNTFIFYKAGWRGINIEPNPAAIGLFNSSRPRDINIQAGVSDVASGLTYFEFDDPALNSFDEALVTWRLANTPFKVVRRSIVAVERLDTLLARCLPPGQLVDFLSVDVEGFDLAVLRSNDWAVCRPRCVLIEALQSSIEGALRSEANEFLQARGYELFAKTFNTLIFRQQDAS